MALDPAVLARQRQSVLNLAFWNGSGVVALSVIGLLLCALFRDWLGVAIAAGVVVSGVLELTGRFFLLRSDPRAKWLLPASQLWLLAIIAGYSVWRILSFDPKELLEMRLVAQMFPAEELAMIQDLLPTVLACTYGAIIVVSVLYQGGLSLFYYRRTRQVLAAIAPSR